MQSFKEKYFSEKSSLNRELAFKQPLRYDLLLVYFILLFMDKLIPNKYLATHILKGVYNWCVDNNFVPMMQIMIGPDCLLPKNFYNMKNLVLNISPMACRNLEFTDKGCSFTTRFNGMVWDVFVPLLYIENIYAKEIGFIFNIKPFTKMIEDMEVAEENENAKIPNQEEVVEKPTLKVVGGLGHIKNIEDNTKNDPKKLTSNSTANQNKDISKVNVSNYSLGVPAPPAKEEKIPSKSRAKLTVIDGGKKE